VSTPDSLPANWDSATIKADINSLNIVALGVLNSAENINNYLSDIINSLSSLPFSWTGSSATLADEFNTKWSAATTALYGTTGAPSTGILNAIAQGLTQDAQNYGMCEGSVASMWSGAFSQSATNSSANSGVAADMSATPATDTVTDNVYHTTSVNETFGG
jgi:uncharacterized protein YukE